MSKTFPRLVLAAAVCVIVLTASRSNGQTPNVTIKIDGSSPSVARIQARFPSVNVDQPGTSSFISDVAGINGLEKRISDLSVKQSNNTSSWIYVADLKPIEKTQAASHVSWLGPNGGILVLDDLLPQNAVPKRSGRGRAVSVELVLPKGWSVFTTEQVTAPGLVEVADADTAVIYVGDSWREKDLSVGDITIRTLARDSWQFTDADFGQAVIEILKHYQKVFGSYPTRTIQVGIYGFPVSVAQGQWEADTRGSTVTIASSTMPFQSQAVQRLHEQLRHELFHLWIPGAVGYTGSYDWFYEGFALYESLKLGVAVKRIRFADMLDTLSRVF